jgi:hypothetical protein
MWALTESLTVHAAFLLPGITSPPVAADESDRPKTILIAATVSGSAVACIGAAFFALSWFRRRRRHLHVGSVDVASSLSGDGVVQSRAAPATLVFDKRPVSRL